MTIDPGQLISFLGLVISVGGSLYAWVMSQGRAAEHDIEKLRSENTKLADALAVAVGRIAKVEGEMTHLPDKDTVHRIELGMSDMKAQINAQAEVVKAVKSTMERVESFLLAAQSAPVPAAANGRGRK